MRSPRASRPAAPAPEGPELAKLGSGKGQASCVSRRPAVQGLEAALEERGRGSCLLRPHLLALQRTPFEETGTSQGHGVS